MDNSLLAFALLIGAQLVFIVSTRQWPLPARALIWLLGAALLGGSAYLSLRGGGHDDLLRAALDAVKEREDSVLVQAVEGNRDFIVAYVAPMLDLFIAFSAVAGALALLAFTPGEGLERIVRGLCDGILGAIAGGLIALVVVAVGFGGYPQRQVLFDIMNAQGVVDGDTIRLGDVSIRLDGIDAPEIDQVCFAGAQRIECGADARRDLARLVEDRVVVCTKPLDVPVTRDTWGRPVVRCTVRVDSNTRFDLGYRVALDGYATAPEQGGRLDPTYATEIAQAAKEGRGIWPTCLLKPKVWRNNSVAREAFVGSNGTEWNEADVVDAAKCAKPPKGKGK